MYGVLAFLRTIICTGVAFVVWYVVNQAVASPGTLLGAMLPVWCGGLVGGVVCAVFNPRQSLMLGFTCALLLAIGFLYIRHGYAGMPLGENTLVTLWPVWFPPAFYLGSYLYILLRVRSQ